MASHRRLPARTSRVPLGRTQQQVLLRDWLLHADSLTARIRARCRHFDVRVLRQGPASASLLERQAGIAGVALHVREVLLVADDVPVVWARTVLQRRGLAGPWYFLRHLGTRPLGARLFTDARIRRDRFVYLAHTQWPAGMRRQCLGPRPLAAGRTVRLVRGGRLAVLTEVLLPGVLALPRVESV